MLRRFSIRILLCLVTVAGILCALAVWWFDLPHAHVEKVPSWHGKSEAAVFGRLGQPDSTYEFTMEKTLGEFQIELYNTYPPDSPNNKNVRIRQHTWNYARHKLTVWVHKPSKQWRVLNTCRYRNGIQF